MTQEDQDIEKAIQAKGLTAPRVTPQMINDEIVSTDFHVFPGSQLTVCVVTLKNGFTVLGESACASPENFNQEIGESIAFSKAKEKIWPLLGFRLKDQLHAG